MVGASKHFPTLSPARQAFAADHRLISLRQAQRRSVLGSGKRVGSILAQRHGLFPFFAVVADCLPSLLSATQRVMPIRHAPTGQDSERRATQPAESAPYPYAVVLLVVRRLAPLSVSDDRRLPTHRTPSRHLLQADPSYPGTVLSSVGGHEIKRIMAGVKACHWVLLPGLVR